MDQGLLMVSQDARLYRLDCATGSTGLIGPIGVPNVTDLAFQGPTLWGLTFTQFLRINPRTGAGTVLGNTGLGGANGLAVSMAGVIYASGGDKLARIDPMSGKATIIGSFGAGLASSGDLAFDSNDNLYAALVTGNRAILARVDPSTGAATPIGSIGVTTCFGLAFHGCHLYGATEAGEVLRIDANTGAGTILGKNNITQWGMTSYAC